MRLIISFTICFVLATALSHAQWTSISPGIDYQMITNSDPNDIYVARMDRANLDVTIDSTLAQGRLEANRETVSGMAQRYDGALGYWGQAWGDYEYDVKVAINGDFWDTTNDWPQSGQIISGWYAKRFTNFTGGSGPAWTLNRGIFLGGCVNHANSKQKVAYPASSQDQNINAINDFRGSDELVVYTPQWNVSTGTDNSGAEVLVQLARPLLILPTPSYASGTVIEVLNGQGDTTIPFDHIVLSATGTAATKLLANTSVGSEVRISQEITHYESDCSTSRPYDWTKTYATVGGNMIFLREGVVDPNSSNSGAIIRNPRTALAFNDDYIFFIVVDGRRSGSVGMTMQEIGDFCLNTLSADNGVNLDGGGSSAMWVDGAIVNVPSDGSERATQNGLIMVSLVDTVYSTALSEGASAKALGTLTLRRGPGTHFQSIGTAPDGTLVTVQPHDLNGVSAKGQNWWLVSDGTSEGWAAESQLDSQLAVPESGWLILR